MSKSKPKTEESNVSHGIQTAPLALNTPHEHYLVKKEVAKLHMKDNGTTFKESFDSIPDEAVTHKDHAAIYAELSKKK